MAPTDENIPSEIIALERSALERWGKGDPSGFLEISAPDVTYFDPFVETRLDGLEALTRWYEALRGKAWFDRYELINPKVQVCGKAALLAFNFVSWVGKTPMRWNCTEAYRHDEEGWRIIQTHWSFTQPNK